MTTLKLSSMVWPISRKIRAQLLLTVWVMLIEIQTVETSSSISVITPSNQSLLTFSNRLPPSWDSMTKRKNSNTSSKIWFPLCWTGLEWKLFTASTFRSPFLSLTMSFQRVSFRWNALPFSSICLWAIRQFQTSLLLVFALKWASLWPGLWPTS